MHFLLAYLEVVFFDNDEFCDGQVKDSKASATRIHKLTSWSEIETATLSVINHVLQIYFVPGHNTYTKILSSL